MIKRGRLLAERILWCKLPGLLEPDFKQSKIREQFQYYISQKGNHFKTLTQPCVLTVTVRFRKGRRQAKYPVGPQDPTIISMTQNLLFWLKEYKVIADESIIAKLEIEKDFNKEENYVIVELHSIGIHKNRDEKGRFIKYD